LQLKINNEISSPLWGVRGENETIYRIYKKGVLPYLQG
jgi:hypothetical protein